MSENVIRAAGGVVVRDGADSLEIVVVHRPKYDDWTLPKGKALPGESDEACAIREVEEETRLRCKLGVELASVSYLDRAGRAKTARYWVMRPVSGELHGANEVDEARWLSLPEAGKMLTYDRDRDVLRKLAARGPQRYLPPPA